MNRDKLMTESSFTNLSRDIGYIDTINHPSDMVRLRSTDLFPAAAGGTRGCVIQDAQVSDDGPGRGGGWVAAVGRSTGFTSYPCRSLFATDET